MNEKPSSNASMRFPEVKHLIGICGNMRVGKNTVGEVLYHHFDKGNYRQLLAFASVLKQAASVSFGVSITADKTDKVDWLGLTVREVYQKLGTSMKHTFGNDIHIRILDHDLHENSCDAAIVTDVRFENEANWIINNYGTIIHVTRPSGNLDLSHESEVFPARFGAYSKTRTHKDQILYVKNSGSLEDLHASAIALMPLIKSRKELHDALTVKIEAQVHANEAAVNHGI